MRIPDKQSYHRLPRKAKGRSPSPGAVLPPPPAPYSRGGCEERLLINKTFPGYRTLAPCVKIKDETLNGVFGKGG